MAEPAEVVEILGREGPKGVSIVKCKLLGKNKVLERTVVGNVKEGDIIYLKETEMEGL
jgi:ribosomal protein S28E/S33